MRSDWPRTTSSPSSSRTSISGGLPAGTCRNTRPASTAWWRTTWKKTEKPDAIIFTDLLEQEVPFSGGLQHIARWHGVARKPTLQGPGDGVSTDFDWSRPAKAASLWVNIYDMELQRVFSSIGGLDMVEAIDTRSSSGRFVRRRSVLESERYLREGIELAFHPFIPMKKYPGKPPE